MTRSNNTTRARAHEASVMAAVKRTDRFTRSPRCKAHHSYKQSKSILDYLTIDSNDTVTGVVLVADAHEAKAEKGGHTYIQYSAHRPAKPLSKESVDEMADQHDQAYRATWSGPDTEPEDSIDAYRLLYGNSIKVAVIASAIIFTAFGLGLGYLLFHP